MVILRVSPNSEFRVRDELHKLGLSALVPVEFRSYRVVNKSFDRRQITDVDVKHRKLPVIRGYVFAGLDVHDWASVTAIREVKGALWIDGRPARLTGTQTAALELLSRPAQRANASGWSPGDKVRVRRGAYGELEAIVSQIKRGHVIATVEMMGKLHTVKLNPYQLEAA